MTLADACPRLTPLRRYLDSLSGRMDLDVLKQVLIENNITLDDVRAACFFSDDHYRRNKISGSKWYDMLVMCWKPGQASLIHDHCDSSCGFKILSGVSTEIVYELTGEENIVRPVSRRNYQMGELCLAHEGDIHKISNESSKNDVVTLHIYSPPLKMSCYEIDPAFNPADHLIPTVSPKLV
jgi:cysteine dioxygenase